MGQARVGWEGVRLVWLGGPDGGEGGGGSLASMCYRGLAGRIPYWGLGGLCRGEGANEMTKEGGCDGGL